MIKFLKQLFCLHTFEYDLVSYCKDFHYKRECRKCGKIEDTFK